MSAASANPEQRGAGENVARPGLVYIRVPKTGSSTAVRIVQQGLATEVGPDVQPRGRLHLHATWGQHADLLEQQQRWAPIATFRDPVERIVSFYRYLQRMARVPDLHEEVRPSCGEVATRPLRDLVVDHQSLFYSSTMPVQVCYLATDFAVDRLGRLLTTWPSDPGFTRRAVKLALDRLELLAWSGLVETLDRDLETLAASRGWPRFAPVHLNRAPAAPSPDDPSADLDAATRRLLADRLEADYLLVEAAREIAAERHRAAHGHVGWRPVARSLGSV